MNSSYKKYSDIFFTVFIILAICTLFFYFLGNFMLFNFWFLGPCLFKFIKGIKIVLFWSTIIFFVLMVIFELMSQDEIIETKEQMKLLYNSKKMTFLDYFKKYIIIKNSRNISEEEFNYFQNKFKSFYEKYVSDVQNYIKKLNNEKCFSQKEENLVPDYIEKLATGIIEDTINVSEFIDDEGAKSPIIYQDDIDFVYSDEHSTYFLRSLFIEKIKDIDNQILNNF